MELNAHQFKMNLGDTVNRDHDTAVVNKQVRLESSVLERAKEMPGVGKPEAGYYDQPSSRARQMALPGMEMSVQDHLKALSERTGKNAEIWTGDNEHQLSLKDPKSTAPWKNYSYMEWNNNRFESGAIDAGGRPPGEIQMISATKRGEGSAMFSTAEALAHEHGYTFPKHSVDRLPDGVQWSQAMMKRRGEKVW